MMDWTDRHCRYFHRLITRDTLLYTEMVTTGALLHGNQPRHLDFSDEDIRFVADDEVRLGVAIRAARSKKKPDKAVLFPTVTDGVKGMAFIEAVLKSSAKGGKWTKLRA